MAAPAGKQEIKSSGDQEVDRPSQFTVESTAALRAAVGPAEPANVDSTGLSVAATASLHRRGLLFSRSPELLCFTGAASYPGVGESNRPPWQDRTIRFMV